jgi:hypothetical protein
LHTEEKEGIFTLQQQKGLPGIPTPAEEAKANFKLDVKNSFAELVITPVHTISDDGEKDWIDVDDTLEIKPYPNPYGFGGYWGHGRYPPEDEERIIANFKEGIARWRERGLTRVKIKHGPATTQRVLTEAQRQAALDRATKGAAEKPKPPDQPALF